MKKTLIDKNKKAFWKKSMIPASIEKICKKANISKEKFISLRKKGLFPQPYMCCPKTNVDNLYPENLVCLLKEAKRLEKQGLNISKIKNQLCVESATFFQIYHCVYHLQHEKTILAHQILKELIRHMRTPSEAIVLRELEIARLNRFLEQVSSEKPKISQAKPTLLGNKSQRQSFYNEADNTTACDIRHAIFSAIGDKFIEIDVIRAVVKKVFKYTDKQIDDGIRKIKDSFKHK